MTNVYTIGQIIHGFRVCSVHPMTELCGNGIRMRHEKTGADLFWLDNGAENMVFSVIFRTLPEDDTGVFHILEHSVLCGSRNYPVKEPFVELLKSSMSTFLNAMTFPDMTMYPVSSRNPRDLMNLTRVYLDAVFYPTAMQDCKRFWQEGWHIDRDPEGNPEYRGVVFNEMKGAMSETDALIERQLLKQLFPDTSYGFSSGGDPECIPDLTWEKYREQYRKFYHPSNACFYLDGRIPINEMLSTIDSYLKEYDPKDGFPDFRIQEPRASEASIFYELSGEEDIRNKSHLTIGRITGTWKDRAENMARGIICDVLTGSNEAPLKRAALSMNLCQDLSLAVDDTGYQSWISVHAENVTDGKEDEILQLLEETGRNIMQDGLDRKSAEASLNRMIYNLREEEEPQGIGRCIRCMGSWLYGGNPEDALETQQLIRELKEILNSGRMEELAADMLTNRNGRVILHARPSHTLGLEKRKAEEARLQKIVSGWSERDRAENLRMVEELEAWQNSPDSDADLRTLPVLTRADADISPEWTTTEKETVAGVPVMRHMIPCNGVVHLRAYFTLTDFSIREMTRAAMMAGMLGRLATKRHDAMTIQQEIKRWTGGIGFALMTRAKTGETESCTPYLVAFASALEENAAQARDLLLEVLTETELEGQEDKIKEMVMQNELSIRQRIVSGGHLIAVKNVLSRYSAEAAVRNALDGEPAVTWVHAFAAHPDQEMAGFLETAGKLLRTGIARKRMRLSITGTGCLDPLPLIEGIPEGTDAPETAEYRADISHATGYRIPAQTGFSARGYHLNRCGTEFSGVMLLAGNILSLEYLWNKVRIQGGAYGAGFQTDRNGNIYSYSFRDPTPGKTLDADRGAADYLAQFAENEENLDKYIISTLNELNPLLSPREKGAIADAREMTGYTKKDAEKVRREILDASSQDLVRCGKWLKEFAEKGSVCIVAHSEALSAFGIDDIRDL